MKRFFFLLFLLWQTVGVFADYSVSGTVYTYSVNASTGIQAVYAANGLSSVTISYAADEGKTVKWYRYTNSLSDRTEISSSLISVSDNGSTTTYSITAPEDVSGYFVEVDGVMKSALWMIDYSKHLPTLNSITATASSDCSSKTVTIAIDKSDLVYYYSNGGAQYSLKMQYELQYTKESWDSSSNSFVSSSVTSDWLTIGSSYTIDAPLVDTKFTLIGDYIASYLGIAQSITSDTYTEQFTDPHIVATQTDNTADNELSTSDSSDSLGGSAPAEITFKAYSNTPTSYYNWTIYKKTDVTNWIARYNDQDITYTFTDSGDYIVYLETTSSRATCLDSASVEFSISESALDLPNYFTPYASAGENDVYKVAYKSLVSFKATIFNRWGNKLYEWTDPSQGWDGKYHGKYVTPGVYFVVVEAKGSDGIKYKKARDINILTTP